MGKIASFLSPLAAVIGLATAKTPKTSDASSKANQADQAQANTGRAALYETSGDNAGQELDPNQVAKRQNLLGN